VDNLRWEVGRVASIEKVGDELLAGAGELADWAAARIKTFLLPPDNAVLPFLRELCMWASWADFLR